MLFGEVAPVAWKKFTDVSEILTASIIGLMTDAVSTSETSVNSHKITWRSVSKVSHLHT
jgi:hypothetical protein